MDTFLPVHDINRRARRRHIERLLIVLAHFLMCFFAAFGVGSFLSFVCAPALSLTLSIAFCLFVAWTSTRLLGL